MCNHALERVQERISMSADEIIEILDTGHNVPIGLEKGTRRMHIVFYSEHESEFFVAVRDEKTKQVVTVLPYHYDSRCKVPYEALRQLIAPAHKVEPEIPAVSLPPHPPSPPVPKLHLRISFSKYEHRDRSVRITLDTARFPGEVHDLEKNNELLTIIRDIVVANNTDGWNFKAVDLKQGKKGPQTFFDFRLEHAVS